MLVIMIILAGMVLITIAVKKSAKWLIEKREVEKNGYIAVVGIGGLLLFLKWILYHNPENTYLAYLVIGIILGLIAGMVPKSNKMVTRKTEKWLPHAIIMYFFVVIYAFASLYFCIEILLPNSFFGISQWDKFFVDVFEFIYFSVVTFATVGFGDIYPVSLLAKFAVCLEILVTFRTITLGAFFITKEK